MCVFVKLTVRLKVTIAICHIRKSRWIERHSSSIKACLVTLVMHTILARNKREPVKVASSRLS